MHNHPTHERLVALGLAGMAKAFEEQRSTPGCETLTFEERVAMLADREAAERDARRLVTRLKFASLRQNACVVRVGRRDRPRSRGMCAHHRVESMPTIVWNGRPRSVECADIGRPGGFLR